MTLFSQGAGSGESPNPDSFSAQGGYYIFPNGLIMQWGKIPAVSTFGYHGNYPIKFPHAIFYHSLQDRHPYLHFDKNGYWLNSDTISSREMM